MTAAPLILAIAVLMPVTEQTDTTASTAALALSCTTTFPPKVSVNDLIDRFGRENVRADSIDVGEGFHELGTVLFAADTTRRVEILWKNQGDDHSPRAVLLPRGRHSRWITPAGIRHGLSLQQLEVLNRLPFRLFGFAFDGAGVVTSWSGGALGTEHDEVCLTRVRLDPTLSTTESAPLFRQLIGERIFSSGHPAMQALNPTVVRVWLEYP